MEWNRIAPSCPQGLEMGYDERRIRWRREGAGHTGSARWEQIAWVEGEDGRWELSESEARGVHFGGGDRWQDNEGGWS